jgi:hypothetical protein
VSRFARVRENRVPSDEKTNDGDVIKYFRTPPVKSAKSVAPKVPFFGSKVRSAMRIKS